MLIVRGVNRQLQFVRRCIVTPAPVAEAFVPPRYDCARARDESHVNWDRPQRVTVRKRFTNALVCRMSLCLLRRLKLVCAVEPAPFCWLVLLPSSTAFDARHYYIYTRVA